MGTTIGIVDFDHCACERSKRPASIQECMMDAFEDVKIGERIILGVSDASGGWKEDFIKLFSWNGRIEFLDWFTARRNEIRADGGGFESSARFVILKVEFGVFNPLDPAHEQEADPDFKGFYRALREMQVESLAT